MSLSPPPWCPFRKITFKKQCTAGGSALLFPEQASLISGLASAYGLEHAEPRGDSKPLPLLLLTTALLSAFESRPSSSQFLRQPSLTLLKPVTHLQTNPEKQITSPSRAPSRAWGPAAPAAPRRPPHGRCPAPPHAPRPKPARSRAEGRRVSPPCPGGRSRVPGGVTKDAPLQPPPQRGAGSAGGARGMGSLASRPGAGGGPGWGRGVIRSPPARPGGIVRQQCPRGRPPRRLSRCGSSAASPAKDTQRRTGAAQRCPRTTLFLQSKPL